MIKNVFLMSSVFVSGFIFSQNTCDKIVSENTLLKNDNQKLKSENGYFKDVLDINKPIYETQAGETTIKVTNVTGNKADKTISIIVLLESKDRNKEEYYLDDVSIIDLEGNEINLNFFKSEGSNGRLTLDVPKKVKLGFTYKDIENEFPQVIKLLRFRYRFQYDKLKAEDQRFSIELRNLSVQWK